MWGRMKVIASCDDGLLPSSRDSRACGHLVTSLRRLYADVIRVRSLRTDVHHGPLSPSTSSTTSTPRISLQILSSTAFAYHNVGRHIDVCTHEQFLATNGGRSLVIDDDLVRIMGAQVSQVCVSHDWRW